MIDAQSLAVLDGASGWGRLGRKSERDMCPCLCAVHAAEQPAAIGSRIDDLRIERTESHRADVQCGQPFVRRSPGLAAVRGLVDALPGPGVEDIGVGRVDQRSEEHTSELQSRLHLVCRLLLEKKKKTHT